MHDHFRLFRPHISRRHFLAQMSGLGVTGLVGRSARAARADTLVELPFGNGRRELVATFPQKRTMLLQRTRPPLLETPFDVLGVFTETCRK